MRADRRFAKKMFHARRTLFAVTVPCCNDCDGGRLSLFDAATEPPPSLLSPTHAAKAHCGRNPRPRPITCAQCEIAPLSPLAPPSIVGLLRSDAPSSSNPNFATGDDVPTSLPSDVCRVRQAVSFHFADHPVPPSASRRHVHDARTRTRASCAHAGDRK